MNVMTSVLDDFVHDAINARRGQALELSESLAHDLERRGLVEIKAKPLIRDADLSEPITGKSPAVGEEAPSSALPAGPASPQTIANTSGSGKRRPGRPRKGE